MKASAVVHYPRPALARSLANDLLGRVPFGDGTNGIFLAGPRRTGKTDFLKLDLDPVLQAEGVVFVMANLWDDLKKEPARVIANAIGKAIRANLGRVAKVAKGTGLKSVTIAGSLTFDTSKIGMDDGMTFTDALEQLITMTGKAVSLIIDEAQHALTTPEGVAAMYALKAARDQLNRGSDIGLMLLMTGSDRDKLSQLVTSYQAPFYGSSVHPMPPLGDEYLDAMATQIEMGVPWSRPLNRTVLAGAFERFRRRPQLFRESIYERAKKHLPDGTGFAELVMADAMAQVVSDEKAMVSIFLGVPPLQQAILTRMLETGATYRPYDADALAFYSETTGVSVTTGMVQKALAQLREMKPSVIWKSARGEYSMDDSGMYVWHAERVKRSAWPPTR